ncbi:MAG: DsbA family protein [Bacteroidota bacterium]
MQHKLIYVYDALCGWCYGFSPAIQAFAKQHQSELAVEVISGGMITGERIGPIGEVASYIKWAYKEVEERTGVTFGSTFLEDVLEEGSAIFTSIPPAIALSIFKTKQPEQQLAFAARLQKAIYYDGIRPKDIGAYAALVEEFGWEKADFQEAMADEKYLRQVEEEFYWTKQFGVTGFPAVFVESNEKLYAIAKGAVPLDHLNHNFQRVKDHINE